MQLLKEYTATETDNSLPVADPGGNPAMGPPIDVGNGVWSPPRGRKNNDSIVNLVKGFWSSEFLGDR